MFLAAHAVAVATVDFRKIFAKYVRYNKVSMNRGCFPYIIPRTVLYKRSLDRGSTVYYSQMIGNLFNMLNALDEG